MKTLFILNTLSILILVGCTTTKTIKLDQASCRSLNKQTAGETCEVLFIDGTSLLVQISEISEDSSSFMKLENKAGRLTPTESIKIPTSAISSITNSSKAGKGFLGLIIGGAAGGLIFYMLNPPTERSNKSLIGFDVKELLGITTAASLVGLYIGQEGVKYKYNFILTAPDSLTESTAAQEGKSTVRTEYSAIVEKGSGYLIILWKGKEIRLLRSEYLFREAFEDGSGYIVVPKHIYELKFK